MAPISYRRHRFPPVVIQHAVWLYLRFTLSYRDVEGLLAESGLDLSYESVRRRVLKFGPAIARGLRRDRPRPSDRWHLDEMKWRCGGIVQLAPYRLQRKWDSSPKIGFALDSPLEGARFELPVPPRAISP